MRFLPFLSLLLLTGCNPVTLKTITLNPTQVTSNYQTAYSETWECSAPWGGLYTNGLGPEPSNPGEAPSGYDDIFNQGANPLPCNEQEQILYRGQVQFDLSQFDSIVSATLNFNGARSTLNAQPQQYPACIATIIGMSTGTRNDGNGNYYWDYDNEASITPLPYCLTLLPPTYSIGVSSQAREWLHGGDHTNNGFIIAGPNLGPPSPPSDNNGAVTWYNGFQLVILYNPALNPRAPQ